MKKCSKCEERRKQIKAQVKLTVDQMAERVRKIREAMKHGD